MLEYWKSIDFIKSYKYVFEVKGQTIETTKPEITDKLLKAKGIEPSTAGRPKAIGIKILK
jgi:hypothetical protein